jgi:hypothetical protein
MARYSRSAGKDVKRALDRRKKGKKVPKRTSRSKAQTS